MTIEELDAIFFPAAFPLRGGTCSLDYVSLAPTDYPDAFRMTIRLVVWNDSGNSIEDVKEQEIYCGTFGADRARIETFLKAYEYVLGRVFTYSKAVVVMLMPHDLFEMTALKLVKAQRKE